jgi:DNA-binding NtrC family response regulator
MSDTSGLVYVVDDDASSREGVVGLIRSAGLTARTFASAEVLRQHPWPGNIRELQNAIERALISCEGTLVTAAHLALQPAPGAAAPPRAAAVGAPVMPVATAASLEDLERAAIQDALHRTHGHRSRAAALLGVTRFQLHTRLTRHGIEVRRDWS